jgi:hypothetical protein
MKSELSLLLSQEFAAGVHNLSQLKPLHNLTPYAFILHFMTHADA